MLPHSVSVVNCDADLAMLPHSVSFVITEDFPRLSLSVSFVNSDVDREMLPHSVSVVNCDADLAMLPHSVSFVITEDFPRLSLSVSFTRATILLMKRNYWRMMMIKNQKTIIKGMEVVKL
jgi:hypothetical protein